jgi:hypothetical protein
VIRPLSDVQRLYDLVRAQRITLFQSACITETEFIALCKPNHESVARLSAEQTEIRPIAPLEDK